MAKYAAAYVGAETFYNASLHKVIVDLLLEKPTAMACVPKMWEMLYNRIIDKVRKISNEGTVEWIEKAVEIDVENMKLYRESRKIPRKLKVVYWTVDKILGGRLEHIISGGAALREYLKYFFYAAGKKIAEGYGTTETAPLIAGGVQNLDNLLTVSSVIPGSQIQIRDPRNKNKILGKNQVGVIWNKGDNNMLGYWKNARLTKRKLVDGWYNTGDLGYLDNDDVDARKNNLVITGRKDDDFSLGNGELP